MGLQDPSACVLRNLVSGNFSGHAKRLVFNFGGGGQATRTPTPEAWAGRGMSNTPPPQRLSETSTCRSQS